MWRGQDCDHIAAKRHCVDLEPSGSALAGAELETPARLGWNGLAIARPTPDELDLGIGIIVPGTRKVEREADRLDQSAWRVALASAVFSPL